MDTLIKQKHELIIFSKINVPQKYLLDLSEDIRWQKKLFLTKIKARFWFTLVPKIKASISLRSFADENCDIVVTISKKKKKKAGKKRNSFLGAKNE